MANLTALLGMMAAPQIPLPLINIPGMPQVDPVINRPTEQLPLDLITRPYMRDRLLNINIPGKQVGGESINIPDVQDKPTVVKSEPLEQQAKGQSLEEFIESKDVFYHGTSREGMDFTNGVWLSTDKDYADDIGLRNETLYGGKKNVVEMYADIKNPMVTKAQRAPSSIIKEAKEKGFDGIIGDGFVVAFNESQLKTKQQLTDIWNEANAKTTEQSLTEQAKGKTLDEFEKQFEFHGGAEKLEGNVLKRFMLDKTQDSGGIFLTPDEAYATGFPRAKKVYQGYIGDKKIIDLTKPEGMQKVKEFIGKEYESDGEMLEFTQQDYDFIFPSEKGADWATFNSDLTEAMGYDGVILNETQLGVKTTAITKGEVIVLPEGVTPKDIWNKANKVY